MLEPLNKRLRRTRAGRILCVPHYTSGAPQYHTDGCDACAEARAKGILRPDVDSVPRRNRGREQLRGKRVDWERVRAVRARQGGRS